VKGTAKSGPYHYTDADGKIESKKKPGRKAAVREAHLPSLALKYHSGASSREKVDAIRSLGTLNSMDCSPPMPKKKSSCMAALPPARRSSRIRSRVAENSRNRARHAWIRRRLKPPFPTRRVTSLNCNTFRRSFNLELVAPMILSR
jgi:hypothetical protein